MINIFDILGTYRLEIIFYVANLQKAPHTLIPKYGAAARSNEKKTGPPKDDMTGYSCSKSNRISSIIRKIRKFQK